MPDDMSHPYHEDNRFTGYYFEDSYVLGIVERGDAIEFKLELVLTPSHPNYQPPKKNEQHCYKKGSLVFCGVDCARWERRSERVFVDAQGDKDFGNIDSFLIFPAGRYELEGDWGAVEIRAESASVTLESSAS